MCFFIRLRAAWRAYKRPYGTICPVCETRKSADALHQPAPVVEPSTLWNRNPVHTGANPCYLARLQAVTARYELTMLQRSKKKGADVVLSSAIKRRHAKLVNHFHAKYEELYPRTQQCKLIIGGKVIGIATMSAAAFFENLSAQAEARKEPEQKLNAERELEEIVRAHEAKHANAKAN